MCQFFNNFIKKLQYKKNIRDGEEIINSIPPLLRYRKTINSFDMASFIICNSLSTKQLLDSKGFSYSISDRFEKIALLQTEVSELIDAFKKGKGISEEGEELADIVIRLMNIPCMYENISFYFEKIKIKGFNENDKMTLYIPGITKNDSIGKAKYYITYSIFKYICELDNNLVDLEYECLKSKNPISIERTAYSLISIILLCQIYAEDILYLNLQDLVDGKMDKNYSRPYRYNTSPELFN